MGKVVGLRCVTCGTVYSPESNLFTCPGCGTFKGTLEVLYDYDFLKRDINKTQWVQKSLPGHYRYIKLLPFENISLISPLQVGLTPIIKSEVLKQRYQVKGIYLKDDTRNATLSYKDRASSIALVKAREKKAKGIIVASTGNAASSMAGFGASVGLPVYVLVPKSIPEGKLLQLVLFNAHVIMIDGTYDECFAMSLEIADKTGLYLRSTAVNPYLAEGKKTSAFEIAEQLSYNLPDYVFVPVGDGCIIESIFKGFKELYLLNLIDKIPRIIGIQAEGSAPLVKAFNENSGDIPFIENPQTIADSINVGVPRDGVKALKAVKESKGFFISVKDHEILESVKEIAESTGVFAEPAAAAAFAGFKKSLRENLIPHNSTSIILLTGNGLKDPKALKHAIDINVPVVESGDIKGVIKAMNL